MNRRIQPDASSAALIKAFFNSHALRSLALAKASDLDKRALSEVRLRFMREAGQSGRDYSVTFKLLDACSDNYRFIEAIDGEGSVSVVLRPEGATLSQQELAQVIKRLLATITARVKKIRREEAVQAITYVGNSFSLYNTTTFKVLRDDGAGHLKIEISGGDKARQVAAMSSHALLDGLYSGTIRLLEPVA